MSDHVFSPGEVATLWKEACGDLQTQLTPAVYNTWILSNPLTQVSIINANQVAATFSCPTAFHATNLKRNLYTQLKLALEKHLELPVELIFQIGVGSKTNLGTTPKPKAAEPQPPKSDFSTVSQTLLTPAQPTNETRLEAPYGRPSSQFFQSGPPPQRISPTVDELFSPNNLERTLRDQAEFKAKRVGLRPDYTFKTFAVSTSNEMAHAASLAVSKNPGGAYNPLFLYGGVGVGKTHLMHAIGYNILQTTPDTNIVYCTGEEFTNEIVEAIQSKRALNFKNKYRHHTQVLMIDDVQFLAGKNAVQEEFFHTFNALIKQSAQIILTSDRPPHEINLLEDRLRSRFEAGLMIDIQQPSFELRTAILLIKTKASGIDLPMNLAQMIAAKVDSARKIEGIINLLRSKQELEHRTIDQALIEELLRLEGTKKPTMLKVQPEEIIKTVANHFRIKQSAIRGKSRLKELVTARHIAMYLLRQELKLSLEEIGKWFSNRDHTSVLHATQKIEDQVVINDLIQQDVSALRMTLTAISH
ncbi:MAG TPA: chromosomal replication initiator protein DnaA [Candidatus Pacebacteria bacterium]|nr:chromosomal replication initiator protein DnaA [Candidatus Paceibacterota bacterium]